MEKEKCRRKRNTVRWDGYAGRATVEERHRNA